MKRKDEIVVKQVYSETGLRILIGAMAGALTTLGKAVDHSKVQRLDALIEKGETKAIQLVRTWLSNDRVLEFDAMLRLVPAPGQRWMFA